VVLPARVRKPRDKAKVEVAVQIVQRFVLARLRNRRFFSLVELNTAIRECVSDLNAKVMRKIGKSRAELLETIDRPALNALPSEPQARDLLEIVDDRHNRGSTIVTSQLPVDHWHEAIGNPTIADAILDRLVHNAHRLTLNGDSMRIAAAKRSGLDLSPAS
jgi:IstB-like ATP binding protein